MASGVGLEIDRWRREAHRFTGRLRNVSLTLPGTALRAVRLHLGDLRAPSPIPATRRERLVVSLTTIPERAHRLRPVLRSLLDQSEPADRLILALPRRSLKGTAYPSASSLDLPKGVDVLECNDLGPATKLLPALEAEPDAVILIVDDDVIYPRNLLETLLQAHRCMPDAAIGYRGVKLAGDRHFADLDHIFATGLCEPSRVDVLFGTWGYLLAPHILPASVRDFTHAPPELFWVDDVWISGQLARVGIPRFVVPATELPLETVSSFKAALTSGVNRSGRNDEIGLRYFGNDW